jgi:transcriptional regulator with XRE-family HTH domain
MGFGENLKCELEYAGISVKELATLSGVKQKTIESYVGPRAYTPSVEVAFSIAQALHVSIEYLMTGKEGRADHPLTALPVEIQETARILMRLSRRERGAVLALVKGLRER